MNKPRLIDANELVIETKKCLSLCETFRGYTAEDALEHFLLLIDEQPTAYDIDEIIKKLESNSWKSPKEPHRLMWLDRAIEIVKGGQNE